MGEQAGDFEKKWQDQFGGIVRFKAPLAVGLRNLLALHIFTMASADLPYEQEDCLLVSDPKAIQYVLQTSRYRFVKPYDTRLLLNTATGKGVHGAEGNATTCLLAPHKIIDRANTKGADHHRHSRAPTKKPAICEGENIMLRRFKSEKAISSEGLDR